MYIAGNIVMNMKDKCRDKDAGLISGLVSVEWMWPAYFYDNYLWLKLIETIIMARLASTKWVLPVYIETIHCDKTFIKTISYGIDTTETMWVKVR